MKIRTSIAAAAAAALAGTAALMLPAQASPHVVTHTLKFISVEKASVNFTSTTGGVQDTDVNSKNKVVGFDMLYFAPISKTVDAANVTLDWKGGFLYGTFRVNMTGAITDGKVTGGTGAFKGAMGTITAKDLNAAGTRTAVVVTYHK
jgi:hypothetical protein